jgi:CRISPR system Cascade subunit CasD
MPEHVVVRLKAPLVSFGLVSGEEMRRTGDFPGRSMVLGLLGNALGLDRCEPNDMARLDRLQAGTSFAVVLVTAGSIWTDVQNARTPATQLGSPSERVARGGRLTDDPALLPQESYQGLKPRKFLTKPVQREKQYLTGVHALVALSPLLHWPEDPAGLSAALHHPARTLWIGRKACPPAAPVFVPISPINAADGVSALVACLDEAVEQTAVVNRTELLLLWEGEPNPGGRLGAWVVEGGFATRAFDRRDWVRGLHTGENRLRRGSLRRFSASTNAA